jgi:hypothetical protein
LRALDERVFRQWPTEARLEHGRRYGWLYLLALGLVVLAVCIWALAAGHPVIFFMDVGIGGVYVVAAALLFFQRRA